MEAIYIPWLTKAPERTETIEFKEFFSDLETLTPVQGKLQVKHQGNYLEVSAKAETIVTLTCHRCLQQYNYRLAIAPSELIWLNALEDAESLPQEQELALEELVESLPPDGYFDPADWLYQQLCLGIPQRQLCDKKCPGIQQTNPATKPSIDRRWASLEALKQKLQ